MSELVSQRKRQKGTLVGGKCCTKVQNQESRPVKKKPEGGKKKNLNSVCVCVCGGRGKVVGERAGEVRKFGRSRPGGRP